MSKLVNVAKYLPWMKRVCSRQIVLDQLDALAEAYSQQPNGKGEPLRRIAQIKKDVARIQS